MCHRERGTLWRERAGKGEGREGKGVQGGEKRGGGVDRAARPVLDQDVAYFLYCLKRVLCFRRSSSSDPEDAV